MTSGINSLISNKMRKRRQLTGEEVTGILVAQYTISHLTDHRCRLIAASSFRNIKEAEKLITDVLSTNSHRIKTTIGHMLPESKLPLEKNFQGQ